jgi:hypothetical protein
MKQEAGSIRSEFVLLYTVRDKNSWLWIRTFSTLVFAEKHGERRLAWGGRIRIYEVCYDRATGEILSYTLVFEKEKGEEKVAKQTVSGAQ